jgi:hypothetical protein
MLIASISSTSANATDHAAALVLISAASLSRVAASSFFESSMPRNATSGGEHHGCGRHGPSERAHAGLINAGNMQHAAGPKDAFIAQQLAQTLTLGAILPAAPRDGIQNGLRAGALVGPQSGFGRTVEWAGFDDDATMNLGEEKTRHAENLAEIAWETRTWRRTAPASLPGPITTSSYGSPVTATVNELTEFPILTAAAPQIHYGLALHVGDVMYETSVETHDSTSPSLAPRSI